MENILITLCARGGSKGIPGKNIKSIAGKPLIAYSLLLAIEFQKKHPNTLIYLSTDSSEIKDVVDNLCLAEVNTNYVRPEYLANDTAGKLDVIIDVKRFAEEQKHLKFDFVMDLDITSPLRNLEDLENALTNLKNNVDALNIFSVSPAGRNPYFNMVELNEEGFAELCKKGTFLTRQSAPAVYDMNASFYIFKREFFLQDLKPKLMQKAIIFKVPHLCFDLDEPIDFEFMNFLIQNNKLTFDFIK
ncbi:acylneuraminate cytidylyltransferase family protein [uncultured Christiangramia sp.]|uniref:acylneuraminate cytidylyltransferase family protein n=1 Tax=Christiangramia sp. 3-2217-3z TaxID=3417564 RepID=UPI0026184358|nr:acylneuraminate cytidylyltransferase family protein [uncultured Christiangramia sp.]